ncbi:MAG: peptide/nickel transport system permease protein [Planctomycetota bacterium]
MSKASTDSAETAVRELAPKKASRNKKSALRRCLPWTCVAVMLAVGIFAPLIANDVPLVAKVDGTYSFPAFADLVGDAPPGPHDLSWKQWWSRLSTQDEDWGWMPPRPYGPLETDVALFYGKPSWAHPFGNDDTGRDVLARVVHGTATAVSLGLPSVLMAALIGTLLGAWAGLARGIVDVVVQRFIELFLCFPTLLFLLFASAFFGSSWFALITVMVLRFWISFARIVRGEMLSLRERDFVLVARGLGISTWRILIRHLMPQLISAIGVTAAFCMASAIIAESTLSFLGVGPNAQSSWGTMLRQGSEQAAIGAWHLWFFPAASIITVVVSCHMLADRLRVKPIAQ